MNSDRWTRPDWARISLIDQVEWSDTSFLHHDEQWQRPDECPQVGAKRAIHVPYAPPATETFWITFQPALSLINGWDEFPYEIELSAIAEVKYVERFSETWIAVEVLKVVRLRDFVEYFEPTTDGELGPWESGSHSKYHAQCNNWHYLEWNCQSDAGYWMIWHDGQNHSVLLMYGHFMIGEPHRAYAGQRVFSSSEREAFELYLNTLPKR